MVLRLSLFVTRVILKAFYGFTVKGLDKIPPHGKLIVAANHRSVADPPVLGVVISQVRKSYILAKRELFKMPLMGWYITKLGAIPLDRHKKGGDLSAVRKVLDILNDEGCVMMFPEGTRGLPSGRLGMDGHRPSPKPGIGLLAHKTGALVLTARIFGTESFPKTPKVSVVFGNIMRFNPSQAYVDFARDVMSDIMSITENGKRTESMKTSGDS